MIVYKNDYRNNHNYKIIHQSNSLIILPQCLLPELNTLYLFNYFCLFWQPGIMSFFILNILILGEDFRGPGDKGENYKSYEPCR